MKTPYPFQDVAIEMGVSQNMLLNDDCGLGKTLSAIWTTKEYHKLHGRNNPVLVVCPKPVRLQWMNEVSNEQVGNPLLYDTDGSFKDSLLRQVTLDNVNPDECWIITHYEALVKYKEMFYKQEWSVMIIDEAHRIKNHQAKRSKFTRRIRAQRKLALTATAMEKKPSDLWAVLNWFDKKEFSSFWRFRGRYEEYLPPNPFENRGYPLYVGPRNLDELGRVLSRYVLRRTKLDVMPELPEKTETIIPILLDKKQKSVYNKVLNTKDIEVDLRDFMAAKENENDYYMLIDGVLSKIVRLQQITSYPGMHGLKVPSAKIKWVLDYLQDNPDEKVVLFTKFRATAEQLHTAIKGSLLMYGGVPLTELRKFTHGDGIRVVIGTISYLGEGVDGLQKASTAIFVDQEWSTIKMKQAVDRIHRMNITEPKHIIYLTCKGTVDSLVLKALRRKWDTAELVYNYLKEYQNG